LTGFLFAAVVLTAIAVTLVVVPLIRGPAERAPVAGIVAALAIPAAVTLLYAGISSYPWSAVSARSVATVAAGDSPDIVALKGQIARQPGDATAWIRLGEAYLSEERFGDAREAYRQALHAGAENDDKLRLAFAEASILADQNAVVGEAGRIVDDVLSRDPGNPKALWYGGMAALGRGDTATASLRWSKLLELSPPPRIRQILEQQLAGLNAGPQAASSAATGSGDSTRIPVRISIKPELAPRIQPGAALFLIARAPGAAGPPLAVVRRKAASLPLDLEISDADSMVPGRTMGGLPEVKLTARLANDGEALPAPGDVFGEATWRPGSGGGPLQITMDQVVR
jgi:cytochrome c-type biogenesis protein CcmH